MHSVFLFGGVETVKAFLKRVSLEVLAKAVKSFACDFVKAPLIVMDSTIMIHVYRPMTSTRVRVNKPIPCRLDLEPHRVTDAVG